MRILGIETSCDETSAAIVEDGRRVLSNVVSSSLPLHAKTSGIIPENAAREQIKYIIPVIKETLVEDVDAVAVTVGPGLIGSLLVGVETARTLSYVWEKPLIPVNHLVGHIYANFIRENSSQSVRALARAKLKIQNSKFAAEEIKFPCIALVVSGGHTDLLLMKKHGSMLWLGGTRDDAAGEAFDKIGRLLGLPYPGGPAIEKKALQGDPKAYAFPRPMMYEKNFDFSFSGLKAAVFREVEATKQLDDKTIAEICASTQQAIIDVLVGKTMKAAQEFKVSSILLAGGVAANQKLREEFEQNFTIFVPEKSLCTDNAAMIAAAAFYNYREAPWQEVTVNPQLHF